MTQQLFRLVVLLFVSGIIYLAGKTFLPDPFQKVTYFVSAIVAILAVLAFIAYMLGIGSYQFSI